MKKTIKKITAVLAVCLVASLMVAPMAFAAEEAVEPSSVTAKAIAAGATILVVAAAGAIAMGITIGKGSESIARQPEAAGNIRTNVMLGLVFIETAIIYALIISILIIFVL